MGHGQIIASVTLTKKELFRLPNLVVITLLENYDYFVHTLDTIGNQWEIFVYRFDLPVTSLYNNDNNPLGFWRHYVRPSKTASSIASPSSGLL